MPAIEHPQFSPYTDNGGTVIAIPGDNFVVIASETRLSSGYHIYTREQSKLFQITPNTIMANTGCWCDALTFAKVIGARSKNYMYDHNRTISTPACAQLVSTMLYYKRFFPYYVSTIVAGLDEEGKGAVYSYDPVGSYERELAGSAVGSSASLIKPFLDNRIGLKNMNGVTPGSLKISIEESIAVIKDLFTSAAERDIYVGDHVDIRIITADGIQQQKMDLRKD